MRKNCIHTNKHFRMEVRSVLSIPFSFPLHQDHMHRPLKAIHRWPTGQCDSPVVSLTAKYDFHFLFYFLNNSYFRPLARAPATHSSFHFRNLVHDSTCESWHNACLDHLVSCVSLGCALISCQLLFSAVFVAAEEKREGKKNAEAKLVWPVQTRCAYECTLYVMLCTVRCRLHANVEHLDRIRYYYFCFCLFFCCF